MIARHALDERCHHQGGRNVVAHFGDRELGVLGGDCDVGEAGKRAADARSAALYGGKDRNRRIPQRLVKASTGSITFLRISIAVNLPAPCGMPPRCRNRSSHLQR